MKTQIQKHTDHRAARPASPSHASHPFTHTHKSYSIRGTVLATENTERGAMVSPNGLQDTRQLLSHFNLRNVSSRQGVQTTATDCKKGQAFHSKYKVMWELGYFPFK